jgi:hypothetical protein
MARPKLEIDNALVEKFAQIGCKTVEIADHFKCSTDTIQRRYAAELAKGRSDLKMSIRRWQIESAQKGNVAMLIWLGKQMLDQSEKLESKVTADVTEHVTHDTQFGEATPSNT